MKTERACDIFDRMFAEIGGEFGIKREQRFINGPGCGLANGLEGAYVAFVDSEGKPVAVTITSSMIERWRWQYSVNEERDTLRLEDNATLEHAIDHIWMHHRFNPNTTPA